MSKSKAKAYIQAIERTRNISAAADELGISQPALSTFLKKIEEELGAPLFDRSKTPLALTEAGRAYLDYTYELDALERKLEKQLSDIGGLRTGRLIIGGASSFNRAYLPSAIARFSTEHPGIEVEVIEDTAPNLATAALEGRIDLFITPRTSSGDDFSYEELATERALLCVPRSWDILSAFPEAPLGGYAPVDGNEVAKLSSEPFIMLHADQQVGKMMRALFERHAFYPSHTITVNQVLTALAFTEAGAGVSLVTEGALRSARNAESIACFLTDADLCTRTIFLARAKNRYTSQAALEFARIMRESIRVDNKA